MYRRLVAAVSTLLAASLTLTGCVSAGGGGDSSPAESRAPGEKITLSFSSSAFQPGTIKETTKIVDAWNAAHPDIQVQYQKVSPDDAHDKLVTQFAGGSAPDVIQNEAADNAGFSRQGYLLDLGSMIPADLKSDIPDPIWQSVTVDGKITSVPYMTQVYALFVNASKLEQAGIEIPTDAGDGWTWDQLRSNAKKLTKGKTVGFAWGLKQPAQGIISESLSYDGTFFSGEPAKPTIKVGPNELKVPQTLHTMLFQDKSMSPSSITLGGSDVVPGFVGGKYATVLAGNYIASQLETDAPKSLDWRILPLLKGTNDHQAANPQTFSIARQSKHPKEAMQFIQFMMQSDHVAALSEADSLIPVTKSAGAAVSEKKGDTHGWPAILNSQESLVNTPAYQADNFTEWKTTTANPAYQEYLGGKIDEAGLAKKLTDGWQRANQ
ncbi:ABC transporter substrate-binding protein [Microlunatus soli]|uniref:ABC-type glycerol-3-phosphate transport system, substrate-binding protein n=1 Tax=Microlunatus soli TaxID=630515 RepID=A0A1H1YZ63_9ACTN|nr:sugar ABC transporter substrate-binding protein [Microlunatus soli]SDT26693.1 ABC-type glycerol-3-phosphate transport system, substrate-binding protein [Microlunatus soli]